MKINVETLQGPSLDWAVAQCEGKVLSPSYHDWFRVTAKHAGWSECRIEQHLHALVDHPFMRDAVGNAVPIPGYSTDWQHSGPVIEREQISLRCEGRGWYAVMGITGCQVFRSCAEGVTDAGGDTPLIAAMRCYVAAKSGDEIEIPAGVI